jgi:hypothetical protein
MSDWNTRDQTNLVLFKELSTDPKSIYFPCRCEGNDREGLCLPAWNEPGIERPRKAGEERLRRSEHDFPSPAMRQGDH